MVEIKSTKGIEKNMHEEIENLVRKAYNEGFEDGTKAVNTLDSCSWEQGVKDGWATIIHTLKMLGNDEDIKPEERAVMRALVHTFSAEDAVEHTKSFVEVRDMMKKPIVKIIGFGEVKNNGRQQ